MKNALLLCFLFCMFSSAQGQATGVFTLLHQGEASFFYQPTASLSDIIWNNALGGDTIILPGGEVGPNSGVTIDKPLTLIGAGIYPAGAPVTNITTMSYGSDPNYNFRITAGGTGSRFEGIHFSRSVNFDSNVSNITFSRCNIGTISYMDPNYSAPTNLVISQCILRNGMTFKSGIGLTMHNCILEGALSLGTQPSNGQVNQCVFLNVATYSTGYNPGVIYTNCAFVSSSTGGMTINNASTYDHCLFAPENGQINFGNDPVVIWGNDGPITNTDPMGLFTYIENGDIDAFVYNNNYTPVTGSLLLGRGVDGQNIGIYGPGITGWKPYAIPSNPHWTQFTPNGSINTNGGAMQVHIAAEAQQN